MGAQVRLHAFQWLGEQTSLRGDVLPRDLLEHGFVFEGQRVPLVAPQGIFKPRLLDLPLSITTIPNGPYDDSFSGDGYLLYRYRGTDPNHRDNVGLKRVMQHGLPLAYFHGIVPGRYLAVWPVYIIGDDPAALTFKVAVDDAESAASGQAQPASQESTEATGARRAYVTAVVRRRLHQRSFRELVLRAYREQCALCRIRHYELLDAAHIIPDKEPEGVPLVRNGISLCKLHHAAYDALMVGITPDYVVKVRPDILEESDGPMLQHGLKELHNTSIIRPHQRLLWPDRDLLEVRYERFRSAV